MIKRMELMNFKCFKRQRIYLSASNAADRREQCMQEYSHSSFAPVARKFYALL